MEIGLNVASNTSAVGTARIRAGAAMNNWLFYATGGAAFVKNSANGTSIAGVACGTLGVFPNCAASAWRPGLAAGLGAEWGFAQNWSAKLNTFTSQASEVVSVWTISTASGPASIIGSKGIQTNLTVGLVRLALFRTGS